MRSFSLRYPACNAHAPYFHLYPAPLYNIFSTLSHKRHDFREKVTEHKMWVLISYTSFARKISESNKNWGKCEQQYTSVLRLSVGYCCQVLKKPELSRQIFQKKYSNGKFHQNPFRGEAIHAGGRTDKANTRFSQFAERRNDS